MVYIYCKYGNMCTFRLLSFWQITSSTINVRENDTSVQIIRVSLRITVYSSLILNHVCIIIHRTYSLIKMFVF